MPMSNRALLAIGKPVLFLALALPALWLIWQWLAFATGAPHDLGFNPQETSNRFSGLWALRCLLLTLALRPLSQAIGKPWPLALRRMAGLYAFAYALIHLGSYLGLDLLFDWQTFARDLLERPYIGFGMAALALLLPLALTSTRRAVRRLGARRWLALHRLVYVAGILAASHFLLLAKGDFREAQIYAALIAGLLFLRIPRRHLVRDIRGQRAQGPANG
ncbi:MAG: sulfite oxidase heme-binding subunit YedZ [Rhodothalassiaceae bacterium]